MSEAATIPSVAPKSVSTFTILVDGNKIPEQYNVLSIMVITEINRIAKATILFQDGSAADQTFPASNADEFIPGKTIEILAGYRNEEESIFKGMVIKQTLKIRKGTSVLSVDCRHEAIKMTTSNSNTYFHDLSDSDIIEQLCSRNGLAYDGASTDLTHKELVQFNCTDWDFMACRAEENGFWIRTTAASDIECNPPDFTQEPILTLVYGATIQELDAEIDARIQHDVLKAFSWDPAEQELIEAEARDPGAPPAGNITASDLGESLNTGEYDVWHSGMNSEELQKWADSLMQKHRLAKIRGTVKIHGIETPQPGQMCELQNVGERFEGKVIITGVRHHIEKSNWQTFIQFGDSPLRFTEKFTVEQPEANALLPAIRGLHIGVVTSLEDPDGEERIQVRMPLVQHEDEGTWMRLCSLDAGNERGWVFRPEIDDEVIVGFLNEDPRFGVILGKVHSSSKPAPYTALDDNHEKGYKSREGLEIKFDDEKKSILVQTPGGHKLHMNDDDQEITLEDSHGNKIVTSSEGIEIKSIADVNINADNDMNMESAMNANIKGSAVTKVEGGSLAELSSSGSTAVKGSIVKIN